MVTEDSLYHKCAFSQITRWARLLRLTLGLVAAAIVYTFVLPCSAFSQSTYSTLVGTVKDASGAVVVGATVTVTNKGTAALRTVSTDETGSYSVPNLDVGTYDVAVEARGFRRLTFKENMLLARQTVRMDAQLEVASAVAEDISITASTAITTESPTIAQTKTNRELVELPVNITARSSGSTSPISTLTSQPGVQTDNNGNISIAGGQPFMTTVTIDGISSVSIRSAGPIAELFPSLDAIAEIRVSQFNNNAEFAQGGDITTVSKSGTNNYHGAAFWHHQNAALDARNPFSSRKPAKVMNNFGADISGPLSLPRLYQGRDRSFFFASYEGLRLPKQSVQIQSVPSLAYRNGDLSNLLPGKQLINPFTGEPYPNNQVPVHPISARVLALLYPLPNRVSANPNALNYEAFFPEPIRSDQFDLRIDQVVSSHQTAFARFTFKDRRVQVAPTGSPLLGPFTQPERVWGVTGAHNFVISTNLVNEVRGGFTGRNTRTTYGVTAGIINQIGITGLPPLPEGANAPNFQITGFQSTGGTAESINQDRTYQILDNLTWTRGSHSLKFGGDFRRLKGVGSNVFGSRRLGVYTFNGSVTNQLVGNPFAAFLIGVPDTTSFGAVQLGGLQGKAGHWALYAQDDWKATSRLTLSYGLRWEYHPMFVDDLLNVTNFLPEYTSVVNGMTVRGAVVVPNEESLGLTAPGFRLSIGDTPILTAEQTGLPFSLRHTQKTSFGPRFGFAYRPFNDTSTVIRGGYGLYIVTLLGGLINAQWGVHASDVPLFSQSLVDGQPGLQYPSPFLSGQQNRIGTQDFLQAQDLHFKDPYVQQWSLTIERSLGPTTGIRISYNGSHGVDLSTTVDFNQIPVNAIGFDQARFNRPYPLWAKVQAITNGASSKYHALTIEANRRLAKGLQFQSSYGWTKNLSNANGVAPGSFSGENGAIVSDRFNLGLDTGNVAFTRRHRFLTTFIWELPVGHNRAFLARTPGIVNAFLGGWQMAGIALLQTGPYLTPTVPGADPSGTGFNIRHGNHRPDVAAGVTGNLATGRSADQWFDVGAFSVPANNLGRFGTAAVGSLVGPGTKNFSMSLQKKVYFTEKAGLQFETQFANVFNHLNLGVPDTVFNTAQFGKITGVQTTEGAGPRVIQMNLRLFF
jgi:hypothetical protein